MLDENGDRRSSPSPAWADFKQQLNGLYIALLATASKFYRVDGSLAVVDTSRAATATTDVQ